MSYNPKQQFAIEEAIRVTFLENGMKVFVPNQFVAAGIGTHEEVCLALAPLVLGKRLNATVQLISSDKRIVWEGSPEEFVAARAKSPEYANLGTLVHFTISNGWMNAISRNVIK